MEAFDVIEYGVEESQVGRGARKTCERQPDPAQEIMRNAGMVLHARRRIESDITEPVRKIERSRQAVQPVVGHAPDRSRITQGQCRNGCDERNSASDGSEQVIAFLGSTEHPPVASAIPVKSRPDRSA